MEIEMKARITEAQADRFKNTVEFSYGKVENKTSLMKEDTYYSVNGKKVVKPRELVRIRKEKDFTENENPTETIFLTIKRKNVDSEGIETNEEYENVLDEAIYKTLIEGLFTAMKLKPYFNKSKESTSFYVVPDSKDDPILHCEIVTVNGVGPYLEIEITTEDESINATELSNCIKAFFKKELGIEEFDGRSWAEIIRAEKEKA